MRKNLFSLLSFLTVITLIASCGKKAAKEAKYIPKDATAVVVVNLESLEGKMKKGNISMDSLIKKVQTSGDTLSTSDKKMLEDFKNSGIAFDQNLYLFIVQKGSMQKGEANAINLLATIKDEAKFEKFVKEQELFKDKEVVKANGFSYVASGNNQSIAWNKEVVIATMYNKTMKSSFDSLGNYKMPDYTETKKEHQAEVTRYFGLKEAESVASLAVFNDMFKEKADGYLFATSAGTLAALSATPLNLPKIEELIKDSYSATTFNFEDGKIVAKGTSYTNAFLGSILKKYAGPVVNINALEKFPSQNINGAMLVSFNPELFGGLLKELEVGGIVDGFLSKQGITSADIYKCLKGEINVIVSDFSMAEREVAVPMPDGSTFKNKTSMPSAKMIFTANIGDKAAFARVMEKAVEAGMVTKTATGYSGGAIMKATGMYLTVDAENFVIASDSATYFAYKAGTGKATLSADVLAKLKGKSTAAFIDINSLIKASMSSISDQQLTKMLTIVNNTFKNVIFSSDNFDGKSVKSEFEVYMADTKQNSLVSLFKMVEGLAVISNEKRVYSQGYDNGNQQALKDLGVIDEVKKK